MRPAVAAQLIREYIYLYGAVSPKDGTYVYLIMPTSNTACFQVFLDVLARKLPGLWRVLLSLRLSYRFGRLLLVPFLRARYPRDYGFGRDSDRKNRSQLHCGPKGYCVVVLRKLTVSFVMVGLLARLQACEFQTGAVMSQRVA